jgi:fumarate reductase flavoprotein subunit
MPDIDYDVVVVGAGGAGLAAAVSAADAGASVLLVEAADRVGGSTALSGGSFMAAGTAQQAAAGYPDDSAAEFFDYYLTFNRWDVDPGFVRMFTERAAPTLTWLESLGVEFRPERLYRAGRERAPRSHRPTGAGRAIIDALRSAVNNRSVDLALGNRVEDLLIEEQGRVSGVRARGDEVRAWSVVLTTGGFARNPQLLARYFPDATRAGEDVWSPAAPTCVGDGLRLGESAGAGTTGTNHGELITSTGFSRDLEAFPPGWLVYVSQAGRRFVDECGPYTVVTPLALARGDSYWAVLDDAACQSAAPDPNSPTGAGSWVTDRILEQVAAGRVRKASTIAELAAVTGIDEAGLTGTIARYNADCAAGFDSQFCKDLKAMKPVSAPPFYAVRMRPLVVAGTGYGLRIDPHAHVLSGDTGAVIPGLYAAGEVCGNVLGPQYLGGGNAVGNALIFGRIAGQTGASDQR